MPKIYKWGSFSLAELRKVAKAYKEHTKVPAPSKMNKKDLIVLLDKHLLLDKDTAEIKVKATMESSLGAVERMPKKMKKTKVPSAPAPPPMVEDKTYKKRVGKSKVPPPKMVDEEQARGASADAMAIAPPVRSKSKIMKELEEIKDGLLSDKVDEKDKTSGNPNYQVYESKLSSMGYEDKYKNITPEEELMRQILVEYMKLTKDQRKDNTTAYHYKRLGDQYYLYANMSKEEKEDILRNEKKIDYKKYYKKAEERVISGALLNKQTLPRELDELILKEATRITKRSDKWEEFYKENIEYGDFDYGRDKKTIVEIINTTLDRYLTAKYKHFKETGNLYTYLDNQKSIILETKKLPPSIATELNERFKNIDNILYQTSSRSDSYNTFTRDVTIEEKNSNIKTINKKIISNFTNLNKLKLLKAKK